MCTRGCRAYRLTKCLFRLSRSTAPVLPQRQITRLASSTDEETQTTNSSGNRGVSVDQDGKSNVWAIEPKMEVSNKSSEETGKSALIAGGGIAVAAVAAALILTNLPDPNQF